MKQIKFAPISDQDIPLITRWFNTPHVQAFYSLRFWTEEEARNKLLGRKKSVYPFLIYFDQKPIGYIQYYPLAEHPWPEQEIDEEASRNAAGLDLFIGEEEMVGKGLGPRIIRAFLEQEIWPKFAYCFVDPDARNSASLKMFQKCGFAFHKNIETHDALQRPVTLTLMLLKKK